MIDISNLLQFKKEKEAQLQNSVEQIENILPSANTSWIKCSSCQAMMYFKEIALKHFVCPKCNHHLPMSLNDRIALLCDEGSFTQFDSSLQANDPLDFVDKVSYKQRLQKAYEKNKQHSSAVSGHCTIEGMGVQIIFFDFSFMGGSLGSVEGEKIVRAIDRAIVQKEGFIIVSTSGGARMQESTFALLQMAKSAAAIKRLDEAKLPYISILTNPTMGGVSASFAMLGDIIIAEPGALIGFAGQRVIEQTIQATLPDGFQRAEFLLEKGGIDMIVNRTDMKKTLSFLLQSFITTRKETDSGK